MKFIRLKEYDGNDEMRKRLIEGMFKPKGALAKAALMNEVTYGRLCNKIHNSIDYIMISLKIKNSTSQFFSKTHFEQNKFLYELCFIICFMMFLPIIKPFGIIRTIVLGIIPTILGYVAFEMVALTFNQRFSIIPLCFARIFIIGTYLGEFLPLFTEHALLVIISNVYYFINWITGLVSLIIILTLIKHMPKRTDEGNEIYGRIKGFRKFLKECSTEEIERIMLENPNYFYDMIPYTYVLGISKQWFKKARDLKINRPIWYYGDFNLKNLSKDINAILTLISSADSIRGSDRLV